MNIQQLRYIVAIDRFRNFARAADACNISQPTLSAMLVKLEDELDVRIFDRTNKVVKPTSVGERIIRQAQKALMETNRINELITESKGTVGGQLTLSIGPTIAPYLLPRFIKHYRQSYPSVELTVKEMKADHMLEAILNGEIDAGIAISGNARQGVLEMPLYTERFYVYLAESCWRKLPVFKPENLEHENMWIMKEAQCLRDSAFSFCKARGNADTHCGRKRRLHHHPRDAPAVSHREAGGKRARNQGRLSFTKADIPIHQRRLHPPTDAQHRG